MYFSIITSLLFIAIFVALIYFLAYAEATLDHFKINGNNNQPPAGFMHTNYMIRNILIFSLVCIGVFHGMVHFFKWYYYLLTFFSCLFLYVPMHDGWYYTSRNKWKAGSYAGFWRGVDSHHSSQFAKIINEPTTRKLLFVWALMLIVVICTLEPFK